MEVMSAKHTPWPWKARIFHQEVFGPDGIRVANCASRIRSDDESKANTQLVAAAPDLLEALEEITKVQMESPVLTYQKMEAIAQAAINKAKGIKP